MSTANEMAFEVALRREHMLNKDLSNERIERMGLKVYHLSLEQITTIAAKAAEWYAKHQARMR